MSLVFSYLVRVLENRRLERAREIQDMRFRAMLAGANKSDVESLFEEELAQLFGDYDEEEEYERLSSDAPPPLSTDAFKSVERMEDGKVLLRPNKRLRMMAAELGERMESLPAGKTLAQLASERKTDG